MLIKKSAGPLTAGEIYERALIYKPDIAKSTIYRNLDAMLRRGEIKQGMMKSGESFYSIADGSHSHYLICKNCNRKLNIPKCPLGDMERDLAQSSDFLITDHTLQIYGFCRDCRIKTGQSEN